MLGTVAASRAGVKLTELIVSVGSRAGGLWQPEGLVLADRGRDVDIVLYDGDYGFAMNIIKNLYLGPGEPGTGDEWKMPPLNVDEIVPVENKIVPEEETQDQVLYHRGRLHQVIQRLVGG